MNLDALRQEIDQLDGQLVALFLRRMELSAQVAEYKRGKGLPVLDGGRQEQLLRRVGDLAGAENGDYARALYHTILAASRSRQNQMLSSPAGMARRAPALAEQGGDGLPPGGRRISMVLRLPHREGSLRDILTMIAIYEAELVRLDRGQESKGGVVCLELEMETSSPRFTRLITDLRAECEQVDYLEADPEVQG